MKKLGVEVKEVSENYVFVERTSAETTIRVKIDFAQKRKFSINTGLEFLNHMIHTIGWRGCFNIDIEVIKGSKLTHTIAEDVGITLGKGIGAIFTQRMKRGVNGFGCSAGVIDEAYSQVALSIEGRPGLYIKNGLKSERVEDMFTHDLDDFLSGFALGVGGTIHIHIIRGDDPHHIWESVFRALGECLKKALEKNEWRKGSSVGIKETLE